MSGAMDLFGDRLDLLKTFPLIYDKEKESRKSMSIGQFDFFSLGQNENSKTVIPATPLLKDQESDRNLIPQWEKELLGLYFSSHPLDNLQDLFLSKGVITLDEALTEIKSSHMLILGVMVTKIRKITTKKGEVMAFLSIEDKTARTDAVVFPRVYQELKGTIKEGSAILLVGKLNVRDGEKSVIVEKAKMVDASKHSDIFQGVTFKIVPEHSEKQVADLKKYISHNVGDTPVRIIVSDGNNLKLVKLKKTIPLDENTRKWMNQFPV